MKGAIIGDIVGSVFEFMPSNGKDFELLTLPDPQAGVLGSSYTDDSICTVAVADILLNDLDPARTLQAWCRHHPCPMGSYGAGFSEWIDLDQPEPYDSYGNGAAMRVSPVAWLNRNRTLNEALADADRVTAITHNHPEGIKGARATTHAIWLALNQAAPQHIRDTIADIYAYNLSRSYEEVRRDYSYSEACQKTVPEALISALEAEDFEDALRNAVALEGDADTLAAIAGSIAEALYGIPEILWERVCADYLDEAEEMREIIDALYLS